MSTDDTTTDEPTCEYIATADDETTGHTDAEVVSGNVVTCTAAAKMTLRPKGKSIQLNNPRRSKRVVCHEHARFLRQDDRHGDTAGVRLWEADASDPAAVVNGGGE